MPQLTPKMPLWRFRDESPVYDTDVSITSFDDVVAPVRAAMDARTGVHRILYTGATSVTLGDPSWYSVNDIPGDDCFIIIEAETHTTITDGMSPNGFSNVIFKNFTFDMSSGISRFFDMIRAGERYAITAASFGATTTITAAGHNRLVGDAVLVRNLPNVIQLQPKYYTILSVDGDDIEVDVDSSDFLAVTAIATGATTTFTAAGHGKTAGDKFSFHFAPGFINGADQANGGSKQDGTGLLPGEYNVVAADTDTFTIDCDSSSATGTYAPWTGFVYVDIKFGFHNCRMGENLEGAGVPANYGSGVACSDSMSLDLYDTHVDGIMELVSGRTGRVAAEKIYMAGCRDDFGFGNFQRTVDAQSGFWYCYMDLCAASNYANLPGDSDLHVDILQVGQAGAYGEGAEWHIDQSRIAFLMDTEDQYPSQGVFPSGDSELASNYFINTYGCEVRCSDVAILTTGFRGISLFSKNYEVDGFLLAIAPQGTEVTSDNPGFYSDTSFDMGDRGDLQIGTGFSAGQYISGDSGLYAGADLSGITTISPATLGQPESYDVMFPALEGLTQGDSYIVIPAYSGERSLEGVLAYMSTQWQPKDGWASAGMTDPITWIGGTPAPTPTPSEQAGRAPGKPSRAQASAGTVYLDGEAMTGNLVSLSSGGLSASLNGQWVSTLEADGSDLLVDGVNVGNSGVLYLSPDGKLTTTPNGRPRGRF